MHQVSKNSSRTMHIRTVKKVQKKLMIVITNPVVNQSYLTNLNCVVNDGPNDNGTPKVTAAAAIPF